MSEIKVRVKGNTLHLIDASESLLEKVVKHFFGSPDPAVEAPIKMEVRKGPDAIKIKEVKPDDTKPIETLAQPFADVVSRPKDKPALSKQLPIDNSRVLSIPIGELIQKAESPGEEEDKSYLKTGIKVKDGVKCYRTKYECPNCMNKGRRYVAEVDPVTCHHCGQTIEKRKVASFPEPTASGNYYIATKAVN